MGVSKQNLCFSTQLPYFNAFLRCPTALTFRKPASWSVCRPGTRPVCSPSQTVYHNSHVCACISPISAVSCASCAITAMLVDVKTFFIEKFHPYLVSDLACLFIWHVGTQFPHYGLLSGKLAARRRYFGIPPCILFLPSLSPCIVAPGAHGGRTP